jgi:YhcH/YjgK/YiaL family protein
MVTDHLDRAHRYRLLAPRIAQALDHVRATDFRPIPDGKYPIDGDRLFALVQRYTTKPVHEGRWEAHRAYIDLQCVFEGVEQIGYAPLDTLTAEPYDADRDLMWLEGHGEFVTMRSGRFMLLWPEDAHMPGIAAGQSPVPVLKVVVKIAV